MIQFIPLIISLPLLGFWLWMLIDLGKNDYISREAQNNWFLMLALLNIFGAIWYYLVEYRNRHL